MSGGFRQLLEGFVKTERMKGDVRVFVALPLVLIHQKPNIALTLL